MFCCAAVTTISNVVVHSTCDDLQCFVVQLLPRTVVFLYAADAMICSFVVQLLPRSVVIHRTAVAMICSALLYSRNNDLHCSSVQQLR